MHITLFPARQRGERADTDGGRERRRTSDVGYVEYFILRGVYGRGVLMATFAEDVEIFREPLSLSRTSSDYLKTRNLRRRGRSKEEKAERAHE